MNEPGLTTVFSSDALGGSELFNLEFLRTTRRRGVAIHAVVPGDGPLCEALEPIAETIEAMPIPASLTSMSRFESQVDVRRLPRRLGALGAYLSSLRRALTRDRRAVCAFGFRSQLAVAAALPRRSCIWVVHEVVPPGPSARVWRTAAKRASRIVSYSQAAASQPALFDRATEVCSVTFDLRRYAGIEAIDSVGTIGVIGDLVELKNHLFAIDLAEHLRGLGEEISVLLVGRDVSKNVPHAKDYGERVQRVASETPGVELIASEPKDMPDVFARIDVLLQVSTVPESFGRVCIEAMAAGRPVIGFDHGGVSELIADGTTGFLCPVGDRDAVAKAVLQLRREPMLGVEMGRAAREDTLARFTDRPGRQDTIGDALADFAIARR